jgi:hypothetical protein
VLDDLSNQGGVPGDYARLADDSGAQWGYPPLVTVGGNPVWRQTNASRHVRQFQSRRSLLAWKVFGERLDGWTNEDHPTESVPGDPDTLPPGAQINEADLDFTGTIMPPPGSGVDPLTMEQRMTIARWIDLGCPIDTAEGTAGDVYGWFLDDLRPTLAVSAPRPNLNPSGVQEIRVGIADNYTGIASGSLSIKSDIEIEGRAPGTELADLLQPRGDSVFEIPLTQPLGDVFSAHLFVEVADNQGNVTRVNREFSVPPTGPQPSALVFH